MKSTVFRREIRIDHAAGSRSSDDKPECAAVRPIRPAENEQVEGADLAERERGSPLTASIAYKIARSPSPGAPARFDFGRKRVVSWFHSSVLPGKWTANACISMPGQIHGDGEVPEGFATAEPEAPRQPGRTVRPGPPHPTVGLTVRAQFHSSTQ
jgi:hypothetical protein